MLRNKVLATAMIGAMLTVGGVVPSQASDHNNKCEQRVRKAEKNLDKEVKKHGEHSRQAEQRRRDLQQAREQCRGNEHHGQDHNQDHR
jgi:uncharacterized protein YlxW (UPF0749 family)